MPTKVSVSDDLKDELRLSTGCEILDEILGGGGLPAGQVTEIYGKSRSGKTTFALQLLLNAHLDFDQGGLEGGALYISTAGRFSSKRLNQIFTGWTQKLGITEEDLADTRKRFYDNIFISHIRDLDTQTHILKYQIPALMERQNIKLIVIDSITANFRVSDDHGKSNMDPNRSKIVFETGQILHSIAQRFKAVVLCINEVSAKFERDVRIAHDSHGASLVYSEPNDGCDYVPALGLALSVIMNNRIRFHRSANNEKSMHVVFSPRAPLHSINFVVDEFGIHG